MRQEPCKIEGCERIGTVGRGMCQKHYTRFNRYGDPHFTKRTAWKVARANQTHQVCVSCGRELPMMAFSLRAREGIHRRDCRECVADRARAYAKAHPEETKRRARRQKLKIFGITEQEYEAMFQAQEGRCLLCGKPERERNRVRLAVDHCHETGRVRGLLCGLCNRQLGWLEGLGAERVMAYLAS